MNNWDEIRTAYQVARMGTVSGAAEVMGVHHATVIRHIDSLEKQLGAKLFQRHARGYTPTEAGRDLMAIAQTTEEQFGQLSSRIKGRGESVSGELVVTAVTGLHRLLIPVFRQFQAEHPGVIIRFLTDYRLFRLDYGEAHVAIRAGNPPSEPDNVVQPLLRLGYGMFAAQSYVDTYGLPSGVGDFAAHRFISADNFDTRAPFYRWLHSVAPESAMTFRFTDTASADAALRGGLGIGFLALTEPREGLVEVMPSLPEWDAALWLVTHVDLHRTLKVQSFLAALKAAAATWPK